MKKLIPWNPSEIRNPLEPVVGKKKPETELEKLRAHIVQALILFNSGKFQKYHDRQMGWEQMQGVLWVIANIDKLMEENNEQ